MSNYKDLESSTAFELSSKRRQGFPSETRVKRGHRIVHGDKELIEKLAETTRARADRAPLSSAAA